MLHTDIIQNKSTLRTELLRRRREIPMQKRVEAASRLVSLLKIPLGATLAGYWPMEDELDVRPLLEQQPTYALPCITARDAALQFRRHQKNDALVKDIFFGLLQPSENAPPVTPDIMLVPMVGFDRRGYRLGMGGGFYDRTLPSFKGKIIGVAFSVCEVDAIPAEPHDIKMNAILTEKELIEIAP